MNKKHWDDSAQQINWVKKGGTWVPWSLLHQGFVGQASHGMTEREYVGRILKTGVIPTQVGNHCVCVFFFLQDDAMDPDRHRGDGVCVGQLGVLTTPSC